MFRVQVDKTQLSVIDIEPTTSGSSQVYEIEFAFSPDWDDFQKTAVFMVEDERQQLVNTIDVLLDQTNRCKIPHEMFQKYGYTVTVGVYGIKEKSHILPTIVVNLTEVIRGVVPGEAITAEPTPSVYEQILARLTNIDESIANGSLVGPPGPPGERGRKGDKGERGLAGKSAYQYALDGGFEGTEEEFAQMMATGGPSIANDEEVEEMLNDVFGTFEEIPPNYPNIATDEDVDNMLNDVFGSEDPTTYFILMED